MGELVCFNPAELKTNQQYRDDVDAITTGKIAEAFDPCVDMDEVPASFVASGLDSSSPTQVREYVQHRPFYQTAACFWERSNFSADADPLNISRIPVSRTLWQQDPGAVISRLALFPETEAMSTAAYILTDYPQNEDSLNAMYDYLGGENRQCASFALTHMYGIHPNNEQRQNIANNVSDKVGPCRAEEDRSALRREEVELARPLLIASIESTHLFDVENRFARSIANCGDKQDLEYLASVVTDVTTDNEGLWRSAFSALIDASSKQPKVVPYLARLLSLQSNDFELDYRYQSIKILVIQHIRSIPPAAELADGVLNAVISAKGRFRYEQFPTITNWFAQCGDKGREAIEKLISTGNLFPELYDEIVKVAMGMVDDPKIRAALKKAVKGSFVSENDVFSSQNLKNIFTTLMRSPDEKHHRLLLEACDEDHDRRSPFIGNLARNFFIDPPAGQHPLIGEYFERFYRLSQSSDTDLREDYKRAAKDAANSIVLGNPQALAANFARYDTELQNALISFWSHNWGVEDPLTIRSLPTFARQRIKAERERITSNKVEDVELRKILTEEDYVNGSLRASVLARLVKDDHNIDFLHGIATDQNVPVNMRIPTIDALAKIPSSKVDLLLGQMAATMDRIGDSAVIALRRRSAVPKLKAEAETALHAAMLSPPLKVE